MIRVLLYTPLLALVYVLVVGSVSWADWSLGALFGGGLLFACRRFLGLTDRRQSARLARHILWLPVFMASTLGDVLKGSWQVALIMLGARPLRQPSILEVPIEGRDRTELAVSSFAHTLSPDSFLLDVDEQRGLLRYQVLADEDLAVLRERYRQFYRRRQRPLFE